jgi:hypothetical protein
MNTPSDVKEKIDRKLPELFQSHVLCAGSDLSEVVFWDLYKSYLQHDPKKM